MSDVRATTPASGSQTDDVVAAVRRDHAEIKDLFARVDSASGDARTTPSRCSS